MCRGSNSTWRAARPKLSRASRPARAEPGSGRRGPSSGAALAHKVGDAGCGHRPAQIKTLRRIATHVDEALQRGFFFDPLGDAGQSELLGEIDDDLDDPPTAPVGWHLQDEGLVDLDLRKRHLLQLNERRIP